jgi:hypothetical protein
MIPSPERSALLSILSYLARKRVTLPPNMPFSPTIRCSLRIADHPDGRGGRGFVFDFVAYRT